MEKQQTKNLSRVGKSLQEYNKNQGVPRPRPLPPTTRMETLAKVFWVNLPASVEKRAFRPEVELYLPTPIFPLRQTSTL